MARPLEVIEIEGIDKFIIQPLKAEGYLFKEMDDEDMLSYIKKIRNAIDASKNTNNTDVVVSRVGSGMLPNFNQPLGLRDISAMIEEGISNYDAFIKAKEKEKIHRKTVQRANKVYKLLSNKSTTTSILPPELLSKITEFNSGVKINPYKGGKRKTRKIKSRKNRK